MNTVLCYKYFIIIILICLKNNLKKTFTKIWRHRKKVFIFAWQNKIKQQHATDKITY